MPAVHRDPRPRASKWQLNAHSLPTKSTLAVPIHECCDQVERLTRMERLTRCCGYHKVLRTKPLSQRKEFKLTENSRLK